MGDADLVALGRDALARKPVGMEGLAALAARGGGALPALPVRPARDAATVSGVRVGAEVDSGKMRV